MVLCVLLVRARAGGGGGYLEVWLGGNKPKAKEMGVGGGEKRGRMGLLAFGVVGVCEALFVKPAGLLGEVARPTNRWLNNRHGTHARFIDLDGICNKNATEPPSHLIHIAALHLPHRLQVHSRR